MSEGCVSVGYTATTGDGGHIPATAMYTFTWLPKGYGPGMDDRMVGAIFDGHGELEGKLGRGERHPLIEAVAKAIEDYLRANPYNTIGFLENR